MTQKTIVIPIVETIEPHLRYSLEKSGFLLTGKNIPTDSNDFRTVKNTMPKTSRRIRSEDLYLRKSIYQHTSTGTEVSLIDYETLPALMIHHDPVLEIDADAPRHVKMTLAKAVLNSIVVDIAERLTGTVEGTSSPEMIVAHVKDACTVMERVFGNLMEMEFRIDHKAYLSKLLSKIAYNVPRFSTEITTELMGEIAEGVEEYGEKSQEMVLS